MIVLLTWLLLPPPCALDPPALSTPHHHLDLRDFLVGAVLPPTRSALGPGVAAAIDPHWASADPAHHQRSEAAVVPGGRQRTSNSQPMKAAASIATIQRPFQD